MSDHIDLYAMEEFHKQMLNEAVKHQSDKVGMADWEPARVWENCMFEIEKRFGMMKNYGPEVIEKQCVHMANYLFFMWVKMKELQK